ncbi:MAG: hypothetical protein AABX11_05205 [Nanoarchaeota archaeon]
MNNEGSSSGQTSSNPLGFGDFFGSSESPISNASGPDIANPFSGFGSPSPSSPSSPGGLSGPQMPANENDLKQMNALKIKIEDLEYKLERLLERINKVEEKS